MNVNAANMAELKIPISVLVSCDLTSDQKLLYGLIFNFRNEHGVFDLSKDLLVRILRINYAKICESYIHMARLGYLDVESTPGRKLVVKIKKD